MHDVIFNKDIDFPRQILAEKKIFIAKQICASLAYLHSRNKIIIHRDLKPSNILVNEQYQVKICDFGISRCESLNDSLVTAYGALCGTFLYIFPEILLLSQKATIACDMWSFACVLVELFGEKVVWNKEGFFDVYACVRHKLENRCIPELSCVPVFLRNKLKDCFNYEPDKRPTALEILPLFENH